MKFPLSLWLMASVVLGEALAQSGPPPDGLATLQAKAEAGEARAQTALGLHYLEGPEADKNFTLAGEWLRKAAVQGDAEAQLELGVMFVNGEGFAVDLREAYAWYLLSSRQGNRQAAEYLDDLNKSLSPAERDRARVRSTELAQIISAGPNAKTRPKAVPGPAPQAAVPQKPGQSAAAGSKTRPPSVSTTPKKGTKNFTEGKDYSVWQRVRINDSNGFGQPVEAYSLLLPKGWQTEGQIRWVINVNCPSDAVQNRLSATSPDGAFRLEMFPQRNWQWFDDPMLLQNARNTAGYGGAGCPLDRPYDAGQYLERVFAPMDLQGAQLIGHRPNEEMTRLMMEAAERNNAAFRASGVNLQSRPSAEIGRLRWPDGRIGIALCSVEQTVATMPNLLNGGSYASYQCRATVKTVLIAPAGREEEAERVLGTIVASTRINPEWQSAVQRVFNNIAKVEQQETAKRAAMWRQTQNEIGDLQRRTWEDSQASRDRIAEGWGQALRGVETWKDPSGGSIELSSGYNEAWSKTDGTYILSNDPLFDPNVAFQENWQRLEKPPSR